MKKRYAIWKDGVYLRTESLTPLDVTNLREQGFDIYDLEQYDER